MENKNQSNQECCPKFVPSLWHDTVKEWNNKLFIKDKVQTFFYIPINFGKVMTRLDKKIRESNVECVDYLCLSEHTSAWNMNLYLAVDKDIANAEKVYFSGKYYCAVYEGSFNNTGSWAKDFEKNAEAKGYKIKKTYFWYTTCPKCAKKFGKNYVVILGAFE